MIGSVDRNVEKLQQEKKNECFNQAIGAGLKASLGALVVSSGVFGMLLKYSDAFRLRFNTSAKASFVAIPTFFMFVLESELEVKRCKDRNSRRAQAIVQQEE